MGASIQRYAVIPLSTNSGLIGWVPHCDTLHALIRDYREKKKILLNIEHRIMLRVRLAGKLTSWRSYSELLFLCFYVCPLLKNPPEGIGYGKRFKEVSPNTGDLL